MGGRRAARKVLQARLARSARQLRLARGWTQEQAAENAFLNPRHYQKLEQGGVNVTLDTLERLCNAFGVDVVELLRV